MKQVGRFCSYCGRKTVVTVDDHGSRYRQCPQWGTFWRWFAFRQKHDMEFTGLGPRPRGPFDPWSGERAR